MQVGAIQGIFCDPNDLSPVAERLGSALTLPNPSSTSNHYGSTIPASHTTVEQGTRTLKPAERKVLFKATVRNGSGNQKWECEVRDEHSRWAKPLQLVQMDQTLDLSMEKEEGALMVRARAIDNDQNGEWTDW
eukprot:CAMPEP_0119335640 /NCGR_PEP_ID=MMETSP1333-20130426/89992_1 /TAXON_ID=418940 /ORGANISM="Scyphosphaera apsteinii, Strain RCC1455" /LENGTH=132 /DNA_ID=CAMNT_0007346239 /DNA_START=193 /DNA_END=588 /DNA_ORIENTATION=-